jgi:hypothetical protein
LRHRRTACHDQRSSDIQQIATLAHELQHALEVAERPWIVDDESFARALAEFGHQRPGALESFETVAAIEAGDRVWKSPGEAAAQAQTESR